MLAHKAHDKAPDKDQRHRDTPHQQGYSAESVSSFDLVLVHLLVHADLSSSQKSYRIKCPSKSRQAPFVFSSPLVLGFPHSIMKTTCANLQRSPRRCTRTVRLLALALALALATCLTPVTTFAGEETPFDLAQLRVARIDPATESRPTSAVLMRLDAPVHFRLVEGDLFSPDGSAEYTVAEIRDDGNVDLQDAAGHRLTIYPISPAEQADYLERVHQRPAPQPDGNDNEE